MELVIKPVIKWWINWTEGYITSCKVVLKLVQNWCLNQFLMYQTGFGISWAHVTGMDTGCTLFNWFQTGTITGFTVFNCFKTGIGTGFALFNRLKTGGKLLRAKSVVSKLVWRPVQTIQNGWRTGLCHVIITTPIAKLVCGWFVGWISFYYQISTRNWLLNRNRSTKPGNVAILVDNRTDLADCRENPRSAPLGPRIRHRNPHGAQKFREKKWSGIFVSLDSVDRCVKPASNAAKIKARKLFSSAGWTI